MHCCTWSIDTHCCRIIYNNNNNNYSRDLTVNRTLHSLTHTHIHHTARATIYIPFYCHKWQDVGTWSWERWTWNTHRERYCVLGRYTHSMNEIFWTKWKCLRAFTSWCVKITLKSWCDVQCMHDLRVMVMRSMCLMLFTHHLHVVKGTSCHVVSSCRQCHPFKYCLRSCLFPEQDKLECTFNLLAFVWLTTTCKAHANWRTSKKYYILLVHVFIC